MPHFPRTQSLLETGRGSRKPPGQVMRGENGRLSIRELVARSKYPFLKRDENDLAEQRLRWKDPDLDWFLPLLHWNDDKPPRENIDL